MRLSTRGLRLEALPKRELPIANLVDKAVETGGGIPPGGSGVSYREASAHIASHRKWEPGYERAQQDLGWKGNE